MFTAWHHISTHWIQFLLWSDWVSTRRSSSQGYASHTYGNFSPSERQWSLQWHCSLTLPFACCLSLYQENAYESEAVYLLERKELWVGKRCLFESRMCRRILVPLNLTELLNSSITRFAGTEQNRGGKICQYQRAKFTQRRKTKLYFPFLFSGLVNFPSRMLYS